MASEQTYMGYKGKTSGSLLDYLNKYDVDQQIVSCALSLVQKLDYSPSVGGVKKKVESKGINSIVVEVTPATAGKGTVKLLDVNSAFSSKWGTPGLSKDMLDYTKRDFLGYKLYIHPDHVSHAKSMQRGIACGKFRVQLLIIPGRGCITLPVSLE